MRALPGRDSRSLADSQARVTRESAKADQRRRIWRATGELVAERGYDSVTVELIVKRARVSYKTFYSGTSPARRSASSSSSTRRGATRASIEAALAAEAGAPWPRQVVAALGALFDVLLADPLIARASIVEAPTVGPSIIERYERAMSDLSPLLRQGREQSPYREELPETLEDTLAGGVLWSAYQRLDRRPGRGHRVAAAGRDRVRPPPLPRRGGGGEVGEVGPGAGCRGRLRRVLTNPRRT